MRLISFVLSILLVGWVLAQQPISINGIGDLGTTIDPITYQRGNNIYDTSNLCLYDNKYQIPCGISIISTDQTSLTIVSTIYDRTFEYPDDHYHNVNIQTDESFIGFQANGKYSPSVLLTVDNMMKTDSTLVVSELDVNLFDMTTNTVNMVFNRDLIGLINNCVEADQDGDETEFAYWMKELFTEFKPGVVVSGTFGAKLRQMTYIANNYYQNTESSIVQNAASASCSFASLFDANGDYNWGVSADEITDFQQSVNSFNTIAVGGEYAKNTNISQWEESVNSNPNLLKLNITLSLFWLQPAMWPQYPENSINRILQSYIITYISYFENNTHLGCTDPYAMNFNLKYNVDDGSCNYNYATTSTWGSKYTYDTSYDGLWPNYSNPFGPNNLDDNLLVGGMNCPNGTVANCYWFAYEFDPESGNGDYLKTRQNMFCDCDGNINEPSSFAFGGAYTRKTPNPITGNYKCPHGMADIDGWCFGTNVPSAVYGGMYRILGDNAFTVSDNNQTCFSPNSYTGNCNCPSWAPVQMLFTTQSYNDSVACYWSYNEYLCLNYAPFLIGVNVGNVTTYVNPNLTLAITQVNHGNSSTTNNGGTTTGITSDTTGHSNPDHKHHHPPQWLWYLIIIPCIMCFAVIGFVILVILWYFCYYKKRNEYHQI